MARKLPKITRKPGEMRGGARENTGGKRPGSGRPRTIPEAEKSAIEKARTNMRSALPELAELMLTIARDPEESTPNRIRAAEFCANRAGLPPEQKITGDGEGKTILALVASLEAAAEGDA